MKVIELINDSEDELWSPSNDDFRERTNNPQPATINYNLCTRNNDIVEVAPLRINATDVGERIDTTNVDIHTADGEHINTTEDDVHVAHGEQINPTDSDIVAADGERINATTEGELFNTTDGDIVAADGERINTTAEGEHDITTDGDIFAGHGERVNTTDSDMLAADGEQRANTTDGDIHPADGERITIVDDERTADGEQCANTTDGDIHVGDGHSDDALRFNFSDFDGDLFGAYGDVQTAPTILSSKNNQDRDSDDTVTEVTEQTPMRRE